MDRSLHPSPRLSVGLEATCVPTLGRHAALLPAGAVGVAFGLGKIVRDCALTCNLGFELAPIAVAAVAVVALPVMGLRSRVSQRLGPRRWQAWSFAAAAVSLVVFRAVIYCLSELAWHREAIGLDAALVRQATRATYLALYVWLGVLGALLGPNVKEEIIRVYPQAQRAKALTRCAAVVVLGALLGASVVTGALPWLGARIGGPYETLRDHLMLAMAATFALGALLSRRSVAHTPDRCVAKGPGLENRGASLAEIASWIRSDRGCRQVARLGALTGMAEALVLYLFYWLVSEQTPGTDGRAVYFARFYTVLNVSTLALIAVGSHRLIERLGLGFALLSLPVAVAIGLTVLWADTAVAVIGTLRIVQSVLGDSLYDRALDRTLLRIEGPRAPIARPLLDGMTRHAGRAIAAALILAATHAVHAPTRAFVGFGIVLAVFWAHAARRVARG